MSTSGTTRQADELDDVPAPEENPTLLGHTAAIQSLTRQLTAGKLPGAILLHGPKGIGKSTAAFAFAKQVFAATGDESEQRIAEQIVQGAHPNLFVLRRKPRDTGNGYYANIRVEEVRSLQHRMRQTRGRAGHRVCVIDAIDDANISAANALLKILEEPPAETMFIAVSHRPGALLPTIHSRCQSHAMRGLSDADVTQIVNTILPETDDQDIVRAVALAEGRPRRAIEALLLNDAAVLDSLRTWLDKPHSQPSGAHLQIAESIARASGAEAQFAREILVSWLAEEVRQSAISGARNRLASATHLWDKAQTMIADADTYNLDARQMLTSLFDGVLHHARQQHASHVAG